MIIFPHEIADGLQPKIETAVALTLHGRVDANSAFSSAKNLQLALAARGEQPDLFPLYSILVSTVWNKNDDVFTKEETWAARKSPEDKPFNFAHHDDDIIGHITGNTVIDFNGEVVDDETKAEDLPDFHILTSAVLYRFWSDAKLQERMNGILESIKAGKLFVSMECHFQGFDYAIMETESGKVEGIITRGEETAWLTKYLRSYGGDGKYGKYRIGRALKNIVFVGKGLVENPANESSVIFTKDELPVTVSSRCISSLEYFNKPEIDMNDTIKLEARVKELETALASVTEAKVKAEAALKDNDIKSVQSKLDVAVAEIKVKDEKISELNKLGNDSIAKISILEKNIQEITTKAKTAEEKLAKIEQDTKDVARKNILATELEMDSEDVEANFKVLSKLSDEDFAAHVAAAKNYIEKKKKKTEKKKDEDDEDTEAVKADAANKVLEKVEVEKTEPALASDTDSGVESVKSDVANYYANKNSKVKKMETK